MIMERGEIDLFAYLVSDEVQKRRSEDIKGLVEEMTRYAREALESYAFLQKHNYIHRDISGENIVLFRGEDDLLHAKLMDFGSCSQQTNPSVFVSQKTSNKMAGKRSKWSEEMVLIQRTTQTLWGSRRDNVYSYNGYKADAWAFGIVLGEMFFGLPLWNKAQRSVQVAGSRCAYFAAYTKGYLPEMNTNRGVQRLLNRMKVGFSHVSPLLLDLLNHHLLVHPKYRLEPNEILKHPLFSDTPYKEWREQHLVEDHYGPHLLSVPEIEPVKQ